ncbi:MAG: ABC transporter substrate-binding protein [Halothiobacillus sp.]|nr:ABC transporter substrate-binding protein [Halothiobacillus sp.]
MSKRHATSAGLHTRRVFLRGLVAAPFLALPRLGFGATPQRVYGANPVVSYLLAALAPESFIGWNFPPPTQSRGYFADAILNKPVIGGFFGQGKTPNVEVLLANHPDLAIVSDAASIGTQVSESQLKKLGIPVKNLVLNTVYDYPDAIRQLGVWLGISDRVQPVADLCQNLLAQLKTLPMPKPAPVIYYAEQDDGLASECPGSFHAEVLDLLHVTNPMVCPGQKNDGFGMVRISIETLFRMNPPWVLTQDVAAYRAFHTDPRYADLMAVKANQVLLAPQVPFRWIDRPPSFMRILAAFWLYDQLYPAHHRFDLRELTKTFMHAFFAVDMTPDQLSYMLNPGQQAGISAG